MKHSLTLAIAALIAAGLTLGCNQDDSPRPRNVSSLIDSQSQQGLTVRLQVPKAFYEPGQTVNMTVTAVNTSSETIDIQSRSSALVKAEVRQYDGVRWETIRTFPQAAAMVITPWQLEPGQSRSFELNLPISEDWPTAETLRLRAWLNSRPEIKPTVEIKIVPGASPLRDEQR